MAATEPPALLLALLQEAVVVVAVEAVVTLLPEVVLVVVQALDQVPRHSLTPTAAVAEPAAAALPINSM